MFSSTQRGASQSLRGFLGLLQSRYMYFPIFCIKAVLKFLINLLNYPGCLLKCTFLGSSPGIQKFWGTVQEPLTFSPQDSLSWMEF